MKEGSNGEREREGERDGRRSEGGREKGGRLMLVFRAGIEVSRIPVIGSGDEVRFISSLEIVYTVDTLVMALQGEVGVRRAKLPHLRYM